MCPRLQSLNDFSVGEGFIGQKKEWEHSLCQAVHVTQKPEPKGMQGCRTIAALEAYLQYLSVLKWVYQGKTYGIYSIVIGKIQLDYCPHLLVGSRIYNLHYQKNILLTQKCGRK